MTLIKQFALINKENEKITRNGKLNRNKVSKYIRKIKSCIKNRKYMRYNIKWIISYFIIGCLVSFILGIYVNNKTNNVSEYIEALASVAGVLIAFEGLLFAKSIFHRRYEVISNHSEDIQHDDQSEFFIDFVNKSRISTSVRFLGAFLNKAQFGYNSQGSTYAIAPYPSFSSKRHSYGKYMNILTNVSAHNAISFKVSLKDLIQFMLSNKTWVNYTNHLFKDKLPIKFMFVFCDYNYVLKYTTEILPYGTNVYKMIKSKFYNKHSELK